MPINAIQFLFIALLPGLIYFGNPAIALLVGMTLSLSFNKVILENSQKYSKYLLQSAIVFLGFKLNLSELGRISADYTLLVAVYALLTLGIGLIIGKLLGLEINSNILMTSGTAICGGTTIATLSPILKARANQVAVALAIVFLLNAIAMFTFPFIGRFLEMSQEQFGVWVAISIHDTSSVVATAQIYGDEAASIATTVKLGRTLWLIPFALAASFYVRSEQTSVRLPIFILLFIFASLLGSALSLPDMLLSGIGWTSKALLVCALYLIGMEITRNTIKEIRGKVLMHALILWMIVVPSTLFAVLTITP